MPRSRSISIRSRYWDRMALSSTTPVTCSIRSASVDLPWSMWAMIEKLRINAGSVRLGCGAVVGGTGTVVLIVRIWLGRFGWVGLCGPWSHDDPAGSSIGGAHRHRNSDDTGRREAEQSMDGQRRHHRHRCFAAGGWGADRLDSAARV